MWRALLVLAFALLPAALFAQAAETPRLTFEVASIHRIDPKAPNQFFVGALPGGNGYKVRGATVKVIISLMLKLPVRQILGGPEWLSDERFDMDTRADRQYTVDDLHTMMLNLLADRFQIRFHHESKEGNIYALLLDKPGSKMKVNTSPPDFAVVLNGIDVGKSTATRMSMPFLCWFLGQILQNDERPVIDQTGLQGYFDFKLTYRPELPPDFPKDTLPAGLLERPSVFEAVRDQLGLRLQPQRGQMPYLVIDHAEELSEN